MLGRLGMSVEDAIREYKAIFEQVFSDTCDPSERHEFFLEAMKRVVEKYTGNRDTLMAGKPSGSGCFTWVAV